jgi:hypothetical protein
LYASRFRESGTPKNLPAMRKILIINSLLLVFLACKPAEKEEKTLDTHAPMNPVVLYMHKSQLMLQGPVKQIDDNERYDHDGNMIYNMGETLEHFQDKIIHKLGSYDITYLKDENGRIYKALIGNVGEVTNYAYDKNDLLSKEYGTENGVDYSTTYEYDDNGRVTTWTYNYGADKPIINYYAYKELKNDALMITISYNDRDEQEVYEYSKGYLMANTRYGKRTSYTYVWDKYGNWTTQSISDGGSTTRKISYY